MSELRRYSLAEIQAHDPDGECWYAFGPDAAKRIADLEDEARDHSKQWDKAVDTTQALHTEVDRLRAVFGHIHVSKGESGTDACRECGLDIRDSIHTKDPTP